MSIWPWIAVAVAWMLFLIWRRRRAACAERMSRPRELRDAELLYIEKRFRIRSPIHLVARLDRAYRTPDGLLVLVELKTRWGGPQLSDIIQLSAQRLAIEAQTGQTVASHGFVTIERPDAKRSLRSYRVQLLDTAQVVVLAHRRAGILDGRVAARYAARVEVCHRCPYRGECDRFFLDCRIFRLQPAHCRHCVDYSFWLAEGDLRHAGTLPNSPGCRQQWPPSCPRWSKPSHSVLSVVGS